MKLIDFKETNIIFGLKQPEYLPLPAHYLGDENGTVYFCWEPSFIDKIKILFGAMIWQQVLTFNDPLQPQKLGTTKPKIVVD